jgi:hypothetical protein
VRRWIRLQSSTTGGEHGQSFGRLTSVCSWRCRHSAHGLWPLLRGALLLLGEIVLTSFVRMTPVFPRGAAETLSR